MIKQNNSHSEEEASLLNAIISVLLSQNKTLSAENSELKDRIQGMDAPPSNPVERIGMAETPPSNPMERIGIMNPHPQIDKNKTGDGNPKTSNGNTEIPVYIQIDEWSVGTLYNLMKA